MVVLTAYVIESPCPYDLILGRDFLEATGMVLDFSKKKVFWDELSVAMNETHDIIGYWKGSQF
eukprot:scaffold89454_cov68-Attheya_sp.AAC.1